MYACTGQRFQLRSKSIFMTSKWPPASNHGNLEMPEIGFDLLKTEQTCHPTYEFGLRQSFVVDAKENTYQASIRNTHWAHCCLWCLVTIFFIINIVFSSFWENCQVDWTLLENCNDLRFQTIRKWGSEKLIRRQFADLIDLSGTSFHPSLWQGNYQSRVPHILQLEKNCPKPLFWRPSVWKSTKIQSSTLPVHYTK